MSAHERSSTPPLIHTIERTTPPSTRRAAPLVAEATGLQTYATIDATSSGVANRLSKEDGRTERKNSFSKVAMLHP